MSQLKVGLVLEEIKRLDPQGKNVFIDPTNKRVRYSLRKKFEANLTNEEVVRAYFVAYLIVKNEFSANNIEVEKEWEFQIGRGNKKPRTDIVIYKNDLPNILYEIKPPDEFEKQKRKAIEGQLFGVANNLPDKEELMWLCYSTIYAEAEISEDNMVIDYRVSETYGKWKKLNEPSFSQLPIKGRFRVLKKGETHLKPLSETDVMKLKLKLHNKLWKGGTRGDNKIFFNLLKVIISKLYDENETKDGSAYTFQIQYKEDGIDYDKTYLETQGLYKQTLLNEDYLDIEQKKLDKLKKIEGGIDKIEFNEEEMAFVINEFQNYSLKVTSYDVLSIFFESIIRDEFKESTGLYFTPINLVRMIIYGLELDNLTKDIVKNEKRLPYIIDPSIGSGTFLTESMQVITETVVSNAKELSVTESIKKLIKEEFDLEKMRHPWAKQYLYGIDLHPHLALTTKVNMIMHGDGHIHIFAEDGLDTFDNFKGILKTKQQIESYTGEVNEQFDVVLSNPPFSSKIENKTREKYREMFPELGEQSSEIIFIERWYQLLKPKGRLGVVLPESVFNTTHNKEVRLFLYKHFWIKAVISLPDGMKQGAFAPFTGTKTSLLFAQKKTPEEIKHWNIQWQKYLGEFKKLKSELDEYYIAKAISREDLTKEKFLVLVKRCLEDNFKNEDEELDFLVLKQKYLGEIDLLEQNLWIFKQVAKETEKFYPKYKTQIYMAHTDRIGYKRTKRNRFTTENELFSMASGTDANERIGKITIDKTNPKTVLDEMRVDVKWDE